MNDRSSLDAEQLRKIREDLLDSIDEELEMSLEEMMENYSVLMG